MCIVLTCFDQFESGSGGGGDRRGDRGHGVDGRGRGRDPDHSTARQKALDRKARKKGLVNASFDLGF